MDELIPFLVMAAFATVLWRSGNRLWGAVCGALAAIALMPALPSSASAGLAQLASLPFVAMSLEAVVLLACPVIGLLWMCGVKPKALQGKSKR